MTILDRIKELSKSRDKTVKEVAIELGLGENYLYSLKNKIPNGQTLQKLADYFNVSVDYLLGREDKPEETLDETMTAYGFSDSLKQSIKSTENYSGKALTEDNYKAMADLVNMYLQSLKVDNNK